MGGAYSLDGSALEGFDYVALGHIHRAQAMGRPAVRYAGSPLKYSFSEARHDKSVMLVELKEKGCVEMTALPLAPKRDMLVVEGPLEALLAAGEPSDSFVRAILTDEGPVLDAAAQMCIRDRLGLLQRGQRFGPRRKGRLAPLDPRLKFPLRRLGLLQMCIRDRPSGGSSTTFSACRPMSGRKSGAQAP